MLRNGGSERRLSRPGRRTGQIRTSGGKLSLHPRNDDVPPPADGKQNRRRRFRSLQTAVGNQESDGVAAETVRCKRRARSRRFSGDSLSTDEGAAVSTGAKRRGRAGARTVSSR